MCSERAQISFEALMLVSLIFIGAVFLIGTYTQVADATIAVYLAKTGAVNKLNELNGTFVIQSIQFSEQGNAIRIEIDISPNTSQLTENSFADVSAAIVRHTGYAQATVMPV